ncbi:hypothetical protein ANCDUO_24444, partial [Ancylostoma duodenale]
MNKRKKKNTQLGEPVRRLKFADWLKTVDDVTQEFFSFCKRVQVVSGPSLAPDAFPSTDPAALMAVEIRSLPQLLKSASILAEFAHHCAQTRLCRLLIARSK